MEKQRFDLFFTTLTTKLYASTLHPPICCSFATEKGGSWSRKEETGEQVYILITRAVELIN